MSACEAALTRAKNLHIDECEAIFVQKKIFTVRITDSEIVEVKQNQDMNLGIRVINQKKFLQLRQIILINIPELLNKPYNHQNF